VLPPLRLCFCLRQDHTREDQTAAEPLVRGQGLVQQQPARQHREDRLQAHDEGCRLRRQMLLTQDLQGEGQARAEDAGVEQGNGAAEDPGQGGGLGEHSHQTGENGHHEKLDAVEPQAVELLGQHIDQDDLHREGCRAAQDQQVADVDAGHAHTAQQIQSHHRQHHADPDPPAAFPSQEEPQHGHQDDVHGGDEARLARLRVL